MIVKKYIVDDMKEAIIRAKYELGPDAVIVDQREIKVGKWYNPFKKRKLEVTVIKEEKKKTKDKKLSIEEELVNTVRELSEEKDLIESSQPRRGKATKQAMTSEDLSQASNSDREVIGKILDINPIFKKASDDLIDRLLGYYKLNSIDYRKKLKAYELKDFINFVYRDNCFTRKHDLARINKIVGPTGVGKTTTIAKIAAYEHIVKQKEVGLITMDTYRIGAVEQLKIYGDILGLSCEVVLDPEEMIEKINKLDYCDLILIDTLGTSQNNKEKLDDIDSYFKDIDEEINTYLTLSMSTDEEIMLSILEKYKQLDYEAIILTKLDELTNFKNFWKILENNDKAVQYFCYGQNVPDDIKLASLENIISYAEEIL